MGLDFNQIRGDESGFYGEAVRLSNELRARHEKTVLDKWGNPIIIPAKKGFDIETCDLSVINDWLHDRTIQKSESLVSFVFRIISIRFPNEFADMKNTVHPLLRTELELIESEARNEIEWLGMCGFQNNIRLDGSLTNDKVKLLKLKNEGVMIKRI